MQKRNAFVCIIAASSENFEKKITKVLMLNESKDKSSKHSAQSFNEVSIHTHLKVLFTLREILFLTTSLSYIIIHEWLLFVYFILVRFFEKGSPYLHSHTGFELTW